MNAPSTAKAEDQPLYGKQTRLAIDNFRIGGQPLPGAFIRALGLIKATAARVNGALEILPTDLAEAIAEAADAVAEGRHQDQ